MIISCLDKAFDLTKFKLDFIELNIFENITRSLENQEYSSGGEFHIDGTFILIQTTGNNVYEATRERELVLKLH